MFYSDDDRAELCRVIKLEEVKLQRECAFIGHRNVKIVGGG